MTLVDGSGGNFIVSVQLVKRVCLGFMLKLRTSKAGRSTFGIAEAWSDADVSAGFNSLGVSIICRKHLPQRVCVARRELFLFHCQGKLLLLKRGETLTEFSVGRCFVYMG